MTVCVSHPPLSLLLCDTLSLVALLAGSLTLWRCWDGGIYVCRSPQTFLIVVVGGRSSIQAFSGRIYMHLYCAVVPPFHLGPNTIAEPCRAARKGARNEVQALPICKGCGSESDCHTVFHCAARQSMWVPQASVTNSSSTATSVAPSTTTAALESKSLLLRWLQCSQYPLHSLMPCLLCCRTL